MSTLIKQTAVSWVEHGKKFIGTKEIKGSGTNSTIAKWLLRLKAWWSDDETPWCGVFVAECLKEAGRDIPKSWFRAKAYHIDNDGTYYGTRLNAPAYGCIAVMSRSGGGHVGFVVGKDAQGRVLVLGGNQGDAVSIAAFPMNRVTAWIWPSKNGVLMKPSALRYDLPVGKAAVSTRES